MKQVKLRVFAFCCLLLLPLVFLSCEKGDASALLGRWETTGTDEELGNYSMVYHFTEDGEIFIEQKQGDTIPFSIPFGTWEVQGKEVTIISDGTQRTFTFSVQGSELTLSGEGEESLIFHRI
ncbi:MAG: hypothetical protein IJC26_00340 [Clostridia bacterium]|nr:hypothetical protein [Clostridia bacterium]